MTPFSDPSPQAPAYSRFLLPLLLGIPSRPGRSQAHGRVFTPIHRVGNNGTRGGLMRPLSARRSARIATATAAARLLVCSSQHRRFLGAPPIHDAPCSTDQRSGGEDTDEVRPKAGVADRELDDAAPEDQRCSSVYRRLHLGDDARPSSRRLTLSPGRAHMLRCRTRGRPAPNCDLVSRRGRS